MIAAAPATVPTAAVLPQGWKQEWSAQYRTQYYVNAYTNESVWIKPTTPANTIPNPALYTQPVAGDNAVPIAPAMSTMPIAPVPMHAHHTMTPPHQAQAQAMPPSSSAVVPLHVVAQAPLAHPQPQQGRLQAPAQAGPPLPQDVAINAGGLMPVQHGYPTPDPSPISLQNKQIGNSHQALQQFPPPPLTPQPHISSGSQTLSPPDQKSTQPGSAQSYFQQGQPVAAVNGQTDPQHSRGLGSLLGGISTKLSGTAKPGKPAKQGGGLASSTLGIASMAGGALLGGLMGSRKHGHHKPAPVGYVPRPAQRPVRPGAAAGGGGLIGAMAGLAMGGRRRPHREQQPVYYQQQPTYYYQQGQPVMYQQAYYDPNGTLCYTDGTTYASGSYVASSTYVDNTMYVSDTTCVDNSTYVDGTTHDQSAYNQSVYPEEQVYAEEQYVAEEYADEESYDYQVEETYDAGGGWDCGDFGGGDW